MHPRHMPHKPKTDYDILPHARHQKISYKDIMKGYENKVASINFRKDMLLRQRNSNYVNEFNRISSVLAGNVQGLPPVRMASLKQRQADLVRLANTAY